ncbi:hypothetical protein [Nocardia sp. NPDC052112]|uniref:hypothetical protein n=1 Tax=Nocardia sp. NPDC052112 TaxID=3155646 RepID=UPI00341DA2E3
MTRVTHYSSTRVDLGAAQAIENAGRTGQITVISVDGIQAALDAVTAGTLTQHPYAEGQLAVQSCLAQHQDKKLPERVQWLSDSMGWRCGCVRSWWSRMYV